MTVLSSRRLGALALAAAVSLGTTACTVTPAPSGPSPSASTTPSDTALTGTDMWIKAADSGMTAVFGRLANDSDRAVSIVSAATPLASRVEMHETVDDGTGQMVMRPVEGGFEIPAHGTFELTPGGNHIMLMGLTGSYEPGDEVVVSLTTADGEKLDIRATVKDYSGANENYGDDHDGGHGDDGGHGGHDK